MYECRILIWSISKSCNLTSFAKIGLFVLVTNRTKPKTTTGAAAPVRNECSGAYFYTCESTPRRVGVKYFQFI